MPQPDNMALDVAVIAVYLVALWLPGGIAAAAVGLRGWTLAAAAPVMTYAIAGLAGPWTHIVGLPYNLVTFALTWLIFVVVFAGCRWLARRRRGPDTPDDPPPWPKLAHAWVAGCALLAAVVAGYAALHGMGRLNAIPQDWDAVFHANGIRYIAETGNGGLFGMSQLNWYATPPGVFYPNAYHLLGALVYHISGASIPVVLNAQTVLWGAMLALAMIAVVRAYRGRAMLAGFTALVAVAATDVLYESMARGPLLPYQTGIVLTPVIVPLLVRYLDRPGADTGVALGAGAVGLLCVHSSALFGAVLLVLPLLLARWWRRPRRVGKEVLLLVATAVPSMLVTAPHLLGAISVRAGYPTASWGAPGTFNTAVGSLLTFQHTGSTFQPLEKWPSIWLVVPLWIGLLRYRRLGYLRWVAGSALLIGGVYVLAVCYPQHWVVVLTSPWWNDSYRLITLAAVPATLIAGHGLAELQRGGAAMLHKLMGARGSAVPVALAAVVLVAFSLLSNGFYHAKNSAVTAFGYGNAPGQDKHKLTVSVDEARAMQWLGHVVRPGQRVMNDRYDGSAWMYAIAGVHPVAAHFDASKLAGTGPALLGADFNRYQSDPMVRADVRKLNVRWVMVDTGYVHPKHGYTRQAGLLGLAHDDWLRQVYRNADVTIYQLIPPPGQRYQPQAGSTKELGG